jgi:response regulator of citrate/malate metabolism
VAKWLKSKRENSEIVFLSKINKLHDVSIGLESGIFSYLMNISVGM